MGKGEVMYGTYDDSVFWSKEEEDSYYAEQKARRAYVATLRVIAFFQRDNRRTNQKEWQGRRRDKNGTTIYLPKLAGQMPSADGEVWLVSETETIRKNPKQGIKVVHCELKTKIFDGDQPLEFSCHRRHGWCDNLHPANHLTVVCKPDQYDARQPTNDDRFWVTRFGRDVHISEDGNFFVLAMKLLRVDEVAKQKFMDEQEAIRLEREAREKTEEEERQAQARRDAEIRRLALEAEAQRQTRQKIEDEDPEFSDYLHRLRKVDAEVVQNTRPAVMPIQHKVGGGCGVRMIPRPRRHSF